MEFLEFKYSIDGIVNFSQFPLDIAAFVGFISSVISGLGILFIVARYLLHGDPTSGWASTICIMLFIGGIQLFCLGIVGKYIGKIFTEVKASSIYHKREKIACTSFGKYSCQLDYLKPIK